MIVKINIIKATILIIATIIIIIAVNYGKESVIFIAKTIVALTNIQIISNGRPKIFGNKFENSVGIKTNIIYF